MDKDKFEEKIDIVRRSLIAVFTFGLITSRTYHSSMKKLQKSARERGVSFTLPFEYRDIHGYFEKDSRGNQKMDEDS